MNAMIRPALLLGILAVGCVNAACPPGFIASTTISGKCYHPTTTRSNFFPAISYCRNLTYGADILSIANGFENSEVASLLQPRGIPYAWIGNAFYDNKPHWITTAAGNSNYSNWGSGTYNNNAALINPSGSWGYTSFENSLEVICQIYPDNPTIFPPPEITCPDGWTPSISVRGKCYKLIDPQTDFFSATRNCLTTRIGDSHAELVTLTSQLEMMELSWTQFYGAWTSLTSWEADGYWHWVETLHPTDYFGPSGQPTDLWDYGGTCAYLDSGNLYEIPCSISMETICQYFPYEPPAPTLPGLICPQNGIASLTKLGTCYYVLGQRQSFQSARSACQALNNGFTHNDLFVPRTAAEYKEFEAIVFNQKPSLLVWLGLTSSNGNWGWIPGRSSNITNIWCRGQPDTSKNPNHQCAFVDFSNYINSQYCWTAGNCTDSHPAICQSTNTF